MTSSIEDLVARITTVKPILICSFGLKVMLFLNLDKIYMATYMRGVRPATKSARALPSHVLFFFFFLLYLVASPTRVTVNPPRR